MKHRAAVLGLSCAALLTLFPAAAPAANLTHIVSSTADSGPETLRQAIADSSSGDTIQFDATMNAATIVLSSGELVIPHSLLIDGTANGVSEITISGNASSRAFFVSAGGSLLKGLTILNCASPYGGAIFVSGVASLTIEDSTVKDSRSTGGGGGIRNEGTLTMLRTTVSGNVAIGTWGGGIDNVFGGHLELRSCTVSGNRAFNGGGIDNFGAGSVATLSNTTVANNVAYFSGGGLYRDAGGDNGTINLARALIGDNDAPTGPDCAGDVASLSYNLVSRTVGCTLTGNLTGNLVNVAPRLGALMPNGRARTWTHALGVGSPAVDAVPSASCLVSEAYDGRNFTRPQDGDADGTTACDMGAYERTRPIVVNSLSLEGPDDPGKCTLTNAVLAANGNVVAGGCLAGLTGADTILIARNGTLLLGSPLNLAAEPIEIVGPGADRLVVSGRGQSLGLVIVTGPTVYTLSGLTLADSADTAVIARILGTTLGIDGCVFRDDRGGDELVPPHLAAAGIRWLEVKNSTFVSGPSTVDLYGVEVTNTRAEFTSCTFDAVGSPLYGPMLVNAHSGQLSLAIFTQCTFRGTTPYGLEVQACCGSGPGSALAVYRGSVFSGFTTNIHSASGGTVFSLGYNVSSDATGSPGLSDLPSTNPALGRLRWNGGTVPTAALQAGSPAVDRVPFSECRAPLDARGVARPRDGDASGSADCDSGAYETTRPIVVNSLLDPVDPGKCTLRGAMNAAGTNATSGLCASGQYGLDTIRFAPGLTGTITLTLGGLSASETVLVEGPGADRLAVSGGGVSRVFGFLGGARPVTHSLNDLTIRNGLADSGSGVKLSYAPSDALSMDRCDLVDNLIVQEGGNTAGAFEIQDSGAFHATGTSVRNTAGYGGADHARVLNAVAWLENCTFAESGASYGPFLVVAKGGYGEATLAHTTFRGSDADAVAVLEEGPDAKTVLRYRASVFQGYGTNIDVASGTGISLGYNVSDDTSGSLTATGDLPSTDPKLGAYLRNGGPTPTFALRSGSPAINRVPPFACGPSYDQRGLRRPATGSCDSGAFERTLVGDVNGDGAVNVSDVLYLINTLFAGGPPPVGTANVNDDTAVNVSDVLYLINFLFAGGPAPV